MTISTTTVPISHHETKVLRLTAKCGADLSRAILGPPERPVNNCYPVATELDRAGRHNVAPMAVATIDSVCSSAT
jgi:hypothetical protein